MRIRTKLLLGLLALTVQQGYCTTLKENVCVVKQSAGDSLLKVYEDVAKQLSNYGYFAAGKNMRSKGKGFGSGMVYKAKDGKHYILTNHHVVGSMDYVDLEFEQENSEKKVYAHCKVKGRTTGEDQDVALVELPDTLKFGELIAAHTGELKDGEEVWTAGFPGLGNQPIWQLGKGIISNTIAKPEGYKNGTLIQHTAQVDPGNSGGPLLKKVQVTTGTGKKKKTVETYEVIGLNTWKALFRENTNYSIPVDVVTRLADSIAAQKSAAKVRIALKDAADSLIAAIKDNNAAKAAHYISTGMAMERAKTSISDMMSNHNEESLQLLRAGETEPALLRLTACDLIAAYQKKKETLSWSEAGSEDSSTSTVTLLYAGKPQETTWVKEDGEWKLSQVSNQKTGKARGQKGKRNREGFYIDDPDYETGIDLTYGKNLGNSHHTTFAARLHYNMRFAALHLGVYGQKAEYKGWDNYKEQYFYKNLGYVGFNGGISAQIPLAWNRWQIVPTVGLDGHLGFWFPDDFEYGMGKTVLYGVGGSKFGYVRKNGKMPYIQIDYSLPISTYVEKPLKSTVINLLCMRLGYIF